MISANNSLFPRIYYEKSEIPESRNPLSNNPYPLIDAPGQVSDASRFEGRP